MSVFFRPLNSNNIFHFFEDKNLPNNIKTISYELGADNSILGKWEKRVRLTSLWELLSQFLTEKLKFYPGLI